MKTRTSKHASLKNSRFGRRWLVGLLIMLLVGAALVIGLTRDNSNSSQLVKDKDKNNVSSSGTASSSAGSQSSATDTGGQVATSSPSSWTSSSSGQITLKSPSSGAKLQTGFDLNGSSQTSQVQYRLLDNKVGVISMGSINVINGNFSGKVSFRTTDTSGRLDVFSYDNNGAEINEIQIPVSY